MLSSQNSFSTNRCISLVLHVSFSDRLLTISTCTGCAAFLEPYAGQKSIISEYVFLASDSYLLRLMVASVCIRTIV